MKRHRKAIGAVFALALVAVLSVVVFQSREPEYQGKSLTAWLEDWDKTFGSPGTWGKRFGDSIHRAGNPDRNGKPFHPTVGVGANGNAK